MSTVDLIMKMWKESVLERRISSVFDQWYKPLLEKHFASEEWNEYSINNRTKIENEIGYAVKIDENYALKRAGQWLSSL